MEKSHCLEWAAEEVERGPFDEEEGEKTYDGGDHKAVTVRPDTDSYISPIGTCGGCVDVELWCAAGHAFRLVVANHKGAEYVGIARG
ncbi:hypothetical protein ACLQ2H_09745 [Streptomyces globisporus]|uniref:hypothetical protein n=1 Tax=Streptomyces globisporus TaxID=1908 RepID=UPI003CFA7E75